LETFKLIFSFFSSSNSLFYSSFSSGLIFIRGSNTLGEEMSLKLGARLDLGVQPLNRAQLFNGAQLLKSPNPQWG
jgi:hypothetical protein